MTNVTKIMLTLCFILIPALAHGLTVTNLTDSDPGSLRDTIANTPAGDTVDFAVTGTITLATELVIDKSLTIQGPGADMLTVSGGDVTRVFNVQSGMNVIINDIRIADGFVEVDDSGDGGSAIAFTNVSSVDPKLFELNDCIVDNNNTVGRVFGAISIINPVANININRCSFTNNSNTGGICGSVIGLGAPLVTLQVNDSTFSNNFSQGTSTGFVSGAIGVCSAETNVTINNSTFDSNRAVGTDAGVFGGVMGIGGPGEGKFTNSTFYNNSAECTGGNCSRVVGGVFGSGADFELSCDFCTFASNSVSCEGGDCDTVVGDNLAAIAAPITVSNSILHTDNPGNNCSNNIISLGYNISNDGTCAVGGPGDMPFTNAFLDPLGLADNGGMTETIALLPNSPAIDMADPASMLMTDQRMIPRLFNGRHDIGAFEAQIANIDITKLTIPSGGLDNPFTSVGFTGLTDCGIPDAFMLDDMDTATCTVPLGTYNISEIIPEGQVLTVVCEMLPETFAIDSVLGTLDFTIDDTGGDVSCLFINSFANTVVRISEELPGANCMFGGTRIESGLDTNQNGVLDDAEVIPEDTTFVCNGAPGDQGPPGPPGMDALNSLILITDEAPGPDNCEFGGIRIDSGLDDDSSGTLEDTEIDSTAYVCNGAPGDNTLISVTPSADCPNGGFDINTGEDGNSNGVLDPGEIDNTSTICNGAEGQDGQDGLSFLINVVIELAGANCQFGGVRVDSGLDDNLNMILDPLEVDDMNFICNGEPGDQGNPGQPGPPGNDGDDGMDGETPIIDLEPIDGGPDSECPNGGVRIKTGIDTNENGELEESEVQITEVVCNGSDGSTGTNSNCSIAASGTSSASLAGLMLYILIPAVVLLRRRIRKKENK